MEKILREIYNRGLYPAEWRLSPEKIELVREAGARLDELIALMDAAQIALFERYNEAFCEVQEEKDAALFARAFGLGAKITMAALFTET